MLSRSACLLCQKNLPHIVCPYLDTRLECTKNRVVEYLQVHSAWNRASYFTHKPYEHITGSSISSTGGRICCRCSIFWELKTTKYIPNWEWCLLEVNGSMVKHSLDSTDSNTFTVLQQCASHSPHTIQHLSSSFQEASPQVYVSRHQIDCSFQWSPRSETQVTLRTWQELSDLCVVSHCLVTHTQSMAVARGQTGQVLARPLFHGTNFHINNTCGKPVPEKLPTTVQTSFLNWQKGNIASGFCTIYSHHFGSLNGHSFTVVNVTCSVIHTPS